MKFGVNSLVLEEDSRTEEKIFFDRLETFKRDCAQTADLGEYLQSLAREFSKQMVGLVRSKFAQIKGSFERGA